MKLTLDHIGAIHEATIELKGLTVIAGENDTGKSTIGKVFFALAQAFSNFPIAVKKRQSAETRNILEQLYFAIRRDIDLSDNREIMAFFSSMRSHAVDVRNLPIQQIMDMIDVLRHDRKISPSSEKRIQQQIDRLLEIVSQEPDEEGAIGKFAHRALKSEFSGEILLRPGSDVGNISLSDGATTILEMGLNDKRVISFKGGHPLGLRDATLIDGPAILQYFPMIRWYDAVGEGIAFAPNSSASIPYHTIDLWNKLQRSSVKLPIDDNINPRISDIVKAEMYFDDKAENFFLRKSGLKIPANNVASGIKALAIIDMLSKGDYVNDDTLLILDEPETNLHPVWQIAYAKTITRLANVGVKILVTTHSPYMLEALRGSMSDSMENANFYLAERCDGRICYTDTLGNISSIIEALASPLREFLDEIQDDDF